MRSGQTQVPEALLYYLISNIAQVNHRTTVYSKELNVEICAEVTTVAVESDSTYWQDNKYRLHFLMVRNLPMETSINFNAS